MQDARRRRFDAVLVWKLDRWGRSVADCVRSLQELASLGVRFLAVTQNLDTDESNPLSRFLLHILAAVSEFEREMIRERVVAGIRNARTKGKTLGRPKRAIRRDEALRLRASGLSYRQIAARLELPFPTVVGLPDAKNQRLINQNPELVKHFQVAIGGAETGLRQVLTTLCKAG